MCGRRKKISQRAWKKGTPCENNNFKVGGEESQHKAKCMKLLTWDKGHFNLIYLGINIFSCQQYFQHLKQPRQSFQPRITASSVRLSVPYTINFSLSIFTAFCYVATWSVLFNLKLCCGLCPVVAQKASLGKPEKLGSHQGNADASVYMYTHPQN